MDNATHLGLDGHKDSIAVGLLRPTQQVPDHRVVDNTPEAVRKLVSRLETTSLIACYEAGPTGYDTYRLLDSLGVRCDVIAPALIPRRAGRRIKTDRLDARNLARLHRAGELTASRVPSRSEEALRDLIRVREDLKDDRRRAQQRIKGFLLRQGRRFPGHSKGWSAKFDTWVRAQRFNDNAARSPSTTTSPRIRTCAPRIIQTVGCLAASKLRPLDRCHGISTDVTRSHEIRVDQVLHGTVLVEVSSRFRCKRSAPSGH